VVILSYGPDMTVTQSPTTSRVGDPFSRSIVVQLRDANGNRTDSGQVVTITAATSSVLQSNGSAVTSATATSVDGVVTFTGLGFQSGVTTSQTLTLSADAFVGTTIDIAPTYYASAVTITSTGTTSGTFVDGVFQSSTSSAANIVNTDLQSALAAGNVQIDSAGAITVSAAVSNATAGSSLTLNCGGSGRFTNSGGAISVAGDLTVTCAGVDTEANLTAVGSIRLTGTSSSDLIEISQPDGLNGQGCPVVG
jgi:hypothetical protein